MISVIIPVYNEEATIAEVISAINRASLEKQVIVVNDGSYDGTEYVLKALKTVGNDIELYHTQHRGKGHAIREGIKKASGSVVLIQDADLEYSPDEYFKLCSPILDGQADVVYGSRFIGSSPHRVLYFWHYVANKFLTLLSNLFTGLNLTDMETGYKAFRREVIQSLDLKEDGFGFEPEVTAKIAKYRVYEVGISYHGRTYADGKKIRFKDGLWAVWCIIKYGILCER